MTSIRENSNSLREKATKKELELIDLREKIKRYNSKVEDLENSVANLTVQNGKIKKIYDENSEKLQNMQEVNQRKEQRITGLLEEINNLKRRFIPEMSKRSRSDNTEDSSDGGTISSTGTVRRREPDNTNGSPVVHKIKTANISYARKRIDSSSSENRGRSRHSKQNENIQLDYTSESGNEYSNKRKRYEAFKRPTAPTTPTSSRESDSEHKKQIMKMKLKEEELKKENFKLKERMKRMERGRDGSNSASRSSQTSSIVNLQDEAINKFISERGTSIISVQKEYKYTKSEDGTYPMSANVHRDLKEWHCPPGLLKLHWTISGYWLRVPKSNTPVINTQEKLKDFKPGRIETYIDIEGNRHKALSYGHESKNLVDWYNLEYIQKCFPPLENTRKYRI